jgi:dCMP deaminase
MKSKYIDAYMQTAHIFANCSTAIRLKVGAIVVKDDRIISIGYNGMPSGWDNDCEDKEWCSAGGWLTPDEIEEGWPYEGTYLDADGNEMQGRYRLKTKPEVLHAEMNALMKLAKSTESGDQATMFITHAPCMDCAKGIYQAGIKSIYYRTSYRDSAGVEFLEKCGVKIEKVEE